METKMSKTSEGWLQGDEDTGAQGKTEPHLAPQQGVVQSCQVAGARSGDLLAATARLEQELPQMKTDAVELTRALAFWHRKAASGLPPSQLSRHWDILSSYAAVCEQHRRDIDAVPAAKLPTSVVSYRQDIEPLLQQLRHVELGEELDNGAEGDGCRVDVVNAPYAHMAAVLRDELVMCTGEKRRSGDSDGGGEWHAWRREEGLGNVEVGDRGRPGVEVRKDGDTWGRGDGWGSVERQQQAEQREAMWDADAWVEDVQSRHVDRAGERGEGVLRMLSGVTSIVAVAGSFRGEVGQSRPAQAAYSAANPISLSYVDREHLFKSPTYITGGRNTPSPVRVAQYRTAGVADHVPRYLSHEIVKRVTQSKQHVGGELVAQALTHVGGDLGSASAPSGPQPRPLSPQQHVPKARAGPVSSPHLGATTEEVTTPYRTRTEREQMRREDAGKNGTTTAGSAPAADSTNAAVDTNIAGSAPAADSTNAAGLTQGLWSVMGGATVQGAGATVQGAGATTAVGGQSAGIEKDWDADTEHSTKVETGSVASVSSRKASVGRVKSQGSLCSILANKAAALVAQEAQLQQAVEQVNKKGRGGDTRHASNVKQAGSKTHVGNLEHVGEMKHVGHTEHVGEMEHERKSRIPEHSLEPQGGFPPSSQRLDAATGTQDVASDPRASLSFPHNFSDAQEPGKQAATSASGLVAKKHVPATVRGRVGQGKEHSPSSVSEGSPGKGLSLGASLKLQSRTVSETGVGQVQNADTQSAKKADSESVKTAEQSTEQPIEQPTELSSDLLHKEPADQPSEQIPNLSLELPNGQQSEGPRQQLRAASKGCMGNIYSTLRSPREAALSTVGEDCPHIKADLGLIVNRSSASLAAGRGSSASGAGSTAGKCKPLTSSDLSQKLALALQEVSEAEQGMATTDTTASATERAGESQVKPGSEEDRPVEHVSDATNLVAQEIQTTEWTTRDEQRGKQRELNGLLGQEVAGSQPRAVPSSGWFLDAYQGTWRNGGSPRTWEGDVASRNDDVAAPIGVVEQPASARIRGEEAPSEEAPHAGAAQAADVALHGADMVAPSAGSPNPRGQILRELDAPSMRIPEPSGTQQLPVQYYEHHPPKNSPPEVATPPVTPKQCPITPSGAPENPRSPLPSRRKSPLSILNEKLSRAAARKRLTSGDVPTAEGQHDSSARGVDPTPMLDWSREVGRETPPSHDVSFGEVPDPAGRSTPYHLTERMSHPAQSNHQHDLAVRTSDPVRQSPPEDSTVQMSHPVRISQPADPAIQASDPVLRNHSKDFVVRKLPHSVRHTVGGYRSVADRYGSSTAVSSTSLHGSQGYAGGGGMKMGGSIRQGGIVAARHPSESSKGRFRGSIASRGGGRMETWQESGVQMEVDGAYPSVDPPKHELQDSGSQGWVLNSSPDQYTSGSGGSGHVPEFTSWGLVFRLFMKNVLLTSRVEAAEEDARKLRGLLEQERAEWQEVVVGRDRELQVLRDRELGLLKDRQQERLRGASASEWDAKKRGDRAGLPDDILRTWYGRVEVRGDSAGGPGDGLVTRGWSGGAHEEDEGAAGESGRARGDNVVARGTRSGARGDNSRARGNGVGTRGDSAGARGGTVGQRGSSLAIHRGTMQTREGTLGTRGRSADIYKVSIGSRGKSVDARGGVGNSVRVARATRDTRETFDDDQVADMKYTRAQGVSVAARVRDVDIWGESGTGGLQRERERVEVDKGQWSAPYSNRSPSRPYSQQPCRPSW